MNRYYVTIPEGCIKYYAPSEQEVKRVFPEATEITPLNDTDHLYFIEQIHDKIDQELGKGRWIVDTVFGKMEYQQFYDPDEPSKPLDGCKYRLIEPIGYTFPILWSLSNPKDFYDTHMTVSIPQITNWTRCNYLEWAKIKKDGGFWKTKVHDRNGWFWANDKGEVYEVDRQRKDFKDNWQKFKDNPDTVQLRCWIYGTRQPIMYFANRDEYEKWYEKQEGCIIDKVSNTLPPNPDLAKNVFKLPWFPIKQSPFSIHQTAVMWNDMIWDDRELIIFAQGGPPYTIETLEAIIREVRNAV